ncbi:MAG: fibrinogen-like YCDxxxxGGGW domain-containing protein [Sandaracinaceae bacterium]
MRAHSLPLLLALTPLALGALIAGCYQSHLGEGGARCGATVCGAGSQCCPTDCVGGARCVSLDVLCPEVRCDETCTSHADCTAPALCVPPDGVCGGVATCQTPPTDCSRECTIVCGCDGNDYCNECIAHRQGQSVSHPGSCEGVPCGGTTCGSDEQCCSICGRDELCVPDVGTCPDVVCPDGCMSNSDCDDEEYCAFEPLACGGPGTCALRPDDCTEPSCSGACGCDGVEYCNACEAAQNGASVGPPELCVTGGCGVTGSFCPPDTYCDTSPSCDRTRDGLCLAIPTACDDSVDPVCGCDNVTYGNPCLAAASGVSVRSRGECDGGVLLASSCAGLLAIDPTLASGPYFLQQATGAFVRVYCDMVTDGGGWTLVGASRFRPLGDEASIYHADLAVALPTARHRGIWNGMRPYVSMTPDVRFTCRSSGATRDDVDLSFYAVRWYHEWITGTDAQSCFSEGDGSGADRPAPARRDNLTGRFLGVGSPWRATGYLEGEDSCDDASDFTVDFDDRGMDSDEMDGTDWGEDDGTPKCGRTASMDGVWQVWVR